MERVPPDSSERGTDYPVMLRLAGKPCLVVGAGAIGERKARKLLDAGAVVTVIAPDANPAIESEARRGRLTWRRAPFRVGDCRGFTLVFAATSDRNVNALVAADSRAHHALVNVADDPDGGDFSVPSSLHLPPLTIAVSTGGAAPGLAAAITQDIGQRYDQAAGVVAGLLELERERMRSGHAPAAERAAAMAALVAARHELAELVRAGDRAVAERRVTEIAADARSRHAQ